MILECNAISDIRGERIRLTWTWAGMDAARPGFKLLRRRQAHPRSVADGLAVADIAGLFWTAEQAWARIEASRFATFNSPAEGGLVQAQLTHCFAGAADTVPAQVVVGYYDSAGGGENIVVLAEITRIDTNTIGFPPWNTIETRDIFHAPGGGPEALAGTLVLLRGHQDGTTPDRFDWTPSGGTAANIPFRERRDLATLLTASAAAPEARRFRFDTTVDDPEGPVPVSSLALEEIYDHDRGEWRREFTLVDHVLALDEVYDPEQGAWRRRSSRNDGGFAIEQIYYYALFVPDPAVTGAFATDRAWRASAMATGIYGLENRLYDMLPAVHKQYDEPSPGHQGEGQLRSFLQIFGQASDQLRSLEEGLRLRHDILNAPPAALSHLARWIGWEPDLTLDEHARRRDIRMAPEIFRTVGTVPNIRALVNRVTGWPCRVKEFVHNILLTNAPETIRLWEVWEAVHDGAGWGAPSAVTRTDGFDGAPAAVLDVGGDVWLFWHADRTGRRDVWLQRLDIDPQPRRAAEGAPDDAPGAEVVDEYPAVLAAGPRIWLFFCRRAQNHRGEDQWDIWARTFDGLPGNAAIQLTSHAAEDRHPAAAVDAGGRIWVFWQSNRRGPTDIWARVFDGVQWGLPLRITTAAFRHESPAAAVDGAGRIWLFWTNDLGDRRQLAYRIFDGGSWGAPQDVPNASRRDESPSAAFWDGRIWLFWHSNRSGSWQIWGRTTTDGLVWEAPFAVTDEVTDDKEPRAAVDAFGRLRLFWRSQRRGRAYRSRTIDTNDPEMLGRLKTLGDRAHYTYDAGGAEGSGPGGQWYARGTVGLYLTPDTADPEAVERSIERVRDFVRPFQPLPVRFVWLTDTPVVEEIINVDGLIDEAFEDDIPGSG